MTSKPPRRVPEEKAATPDEISAAIEALTPPQTARLRRYADNRIRKLGPKADRRTGEDLFPIALTSVLDGTRRWDKTKVDFVGFMTGAMKSISSNWARGYKPEETLALEIDVQKKNDEGETLGFLDHVQDERPGPQQRMIDEEKRQTDEKILDAVDRLFKDDDKAQMVLSALEEGYDPPGVRALWELSQNDYDTIVRRIRRTIDRAGLNAREREIMTNKRTDQEKLDALIDALGDSILQESDEEILEDLRQAGIDPAAEASRLKTMMLDTVRTFQKRHLLAAREGYSRQLEQLDQKTYRIPDTPQKRRELFSFFTRQPQFADFVTAHNRDLEALTDNDIETYLEDLAELGILEKLNPERNDGKE